MWILAVPLGCALALTMVVQQRPGPQAASLAALRNWIGAVSTHNPGSSDDSARIVSALSCDERTRLSVVVPLLLEGLTSQRWNSSDSLASAVLDIARGLSLDPGTDVFLKRAVVLHTDAAAYATVSQIQPTACVDPARPGSTKPDSGTGRPRDVGDTPDSPFLTSTRLVLDKDGQILGDAAANWNWSVARFLVRRLAPKPADHPFVGAWYHAATAYMFAKGQYGEAMPHLQSASLVIPDDPRALFDRACYAEIMGLPMHQVLLSDADLGAMRAQRAGAGSPLSRQFLVVDIGIPLPEVTNAEAERLFRRAVAADPSLVEARVRLARLLDLRDRHENAAAELKLALESKPTGIVAFYAHLFAARAARQLGQFQEAAAHYQKAMVLFPDAQSALLGLSQVALLQSDVSGALGPLRRLGDRSADSDADPWWKYHLAAGRDADSLLRDIWQQVRK